MNSIKTAIKNSFSTFKSPKSDPNGQKRSSLDHKTVGSDGSQARKSLAPENPTVKFVREANQRLDALEKDMDKHFPNDPIGWMEHQIEQGLVTPKKQ
ncbi:MAG: hypothetical protein EOO61_20195 [Hymenobacter sp.]|nr:MAG: hypothetical protein EOO61_20195 [Hymenobacter sp.]